MKLKNFLKKKKILLLNIMLTFYIATNLVGGERGLISYFEKKNLEKKLINERSLLNKSLNEIENKNSLLSSNLDFDYLDTIYREKLKYGKKEEIIIKIKNDN